MARPTLPAMRRPAAEHQTSDSESRLGLCPNLALVAPPEVIVVASSLASVLEGEASDYYSLFHKWTNPKSINSSAVLETQQQQHQQQLCIEGSYQIDRL